MSVQAKVGNKRNLLCLFCFRLSFCFSPFNRCFRFLLCKHYIAMTSTVTGNGVGASICFFFNYYYCYNRFIFAKMFSLIVVFCCLILKQSIFLIVSIQLHLPRLYPHQRLEAISIRRTHPSVTFAFPKFLKLYLNSAIATRERERHSIN